MTLRACSDPVGPSTARSSPGLSEPFPGSATPTALGIVSRVSGPDRFALPTRWVTRRISIRLARFPQVKGCVGRVFYGVGMHGSGVAFGERVVYLTADHRYPLPPRVLLPGPGVTVAERADNAIDPVSAQQTKEARLELGMSLYDQCDVDIPSAERIYPPSSYDYRYAQAVLDWGDWSHHLDQCPPGAKLAALLEERPNAPQPPPGAGTVLNDTIQLGGKDGLTLRKIFTDPKLEPVPAPDPNDVWPRTVLESVVARQRLISHLQAEQYDDLATLSACYPGIHQFLATEVGLALHLTDSESADLVSTAEALRNRLPDTGKALRDGRIDDAKAMAIVHATANCSAGDAHRVEQTVLPDAENVTATAVRRRAGRAVIAIDPDGAAHRHREAKKERHIWRNPEPDGMGRLGIYASAEDIDTIWRAVTAVADAIKTPGDTRRLGERRADAMVLICSDILNAGGWDRIRLPDKGFARPRINVTVPYTVLLGHRAPCELDGHGPIPTEQALPLISVGDLYRIICDPESGMVLDYGHERYRPPPHLQEFVRLRDQECPLPTCHHPAERGQVDHIKPARPDPVTGKPTYGTTSADNLGTPCPHHHLSKDAGRGFRLVRSDDGAYNWTTPLGFSYSWRPEPRWHQDTDAVDGDWADGFARPEDDAQGGDEASPNDASGSPGPFTNDLSAGAGPSTNDASGSAGPFTNDPYDDSPRSIYARITAAARARRVAAGLSPDATDPDDAEPPF